jgi:hypothetical protein
MNRRSLFSYCLVWLVAVSAFGCSSIPFLKSAKDKEPASQVVTSNIQWGERKWEVYGKDNNGTTHYLDKSSISYPAKSMIHVWRRRVFPQPTAGIREVRSSHKEIVALDEMDCKGEKYRSLESQGINWDGTPTVVWKKPTPWTPIYDDSADDRILRDYCKQAAGAEKR